MQNDTLLLNPMPFLKKFASFVDRRRKIITSKRNHSTTQSNYVLKHIFAYEFLFWENFDLTELITLFIIVF